MNYIMDALKKYAVFSGRARRKEFWFFVLAYGIVASILQAITGKMGTAGMIILAIYALGLLLPSIAVAVRRMHDIGKSGWWILITLIPIIGGIWFLVLALKDSQPGSNQYGSNPKEIG